jgi:isopenicillin-N N-acyltransferase like protein
MNSHEVPIHPAPPPMIEVKGSHREIGRQIGEACTIQVRRSIENARSLISSTYSVLELTWEGALIQASKYLPFAQERYPRYIEELNGIAEGAGVPFDDLAVLTAMEAVTMDALHLTRCTSFAVNGDRTMNGHVLIAHNEDWLPEDEDDVLIIHAVPDKEPPFMSMTYGGLLPNIGFNAAGIAQCCDSVYPKDCRVGIPRVVVSRAVLGAANLEEAIGFMLSPHRAAGYNHLLAHESGELYNVEVSARRFAILPASDNIIAHTNHYLDPGMQTIESNAEELIGTRIRYFRALRLLKNHPLHSVESLQEIQRDHVNFPNAICNHIQEGNTPLDKEKTINALVIDLTERVMHLAWGNPCTNQYYTYRLNC